LVSAGSLLDTNAGANNIMASATDLTAGGHIATTVDPLETAVETLNAAAATGGIFIAESDGITLNNVVAGGGQVRVSNTTGNMIVNTLTATAGGIDLTAAAGSILDGNGATINLTATGDSTLKATGGVIGLAQDPIEVNINPAMLGVAATGQIAGVSVNIDGTVSPGNTLTLLDSAPGQVIFNGAALNLSSPVVNLEMLSEVASNLDMQEVNEPGYFSPLLLDILDDDFFAREPDYWELDENLKQDLEVPERFKPDF